MNIKFRENLNRYQVDVIVNGQVMYSDPEYRGAAFWAKNRYNLTDVQLRSIYNEYKDDLEIQEDEDDV